MAVEDSLFDTAPKSRVAVPHLILSGASSSAALNLGAGASLIGLVTPAAWTTAPISFLGSVDGTTFVPVYANGALYSIASPAASSGYALDLPSLLPWRWVKVVSGVPETLVNQAADRVLTLVVRALA